MAAFNRTKWSLTFAMPWMQQLPTVSRAAGELSWALDLPSALAQIIQYEEALDEHFYSKFAALCQYDESRYPIYISEHMKKLHPVIISGGQLIRKPFTRKENTVAA